MKYKSLICSLLIILCPSLIAYQSSKNLIIEGDKIAVEFNEHMHSRIISKLDGASLVLGEFTPSEYIIVNGNKISDFQLVDNSVNPYEDKIGKGKQYILVGNSKNLEKKITITSYDNFPTMLFFEVTYTNKGANEIEINGWSNNHYSFTAIPRKDNKPLFWSYQPGSYGWENDWLQPLKEDFKRENYMGMTHVDYGGGTPVVDIWREDVGLAIGHVELVPKLVSLPVNMPSEKEVMMAVTYNHELILEPGDSLPTFRTFAAVHNGDHFNVLTEYSKFMSSQGIKFKDPPKGAYGSIWCAWGYEENFTMDQFYGTFPEIKKLGIDWIVLDYGWSTGLGDGIPQKDKFPEGDADMRRLVEKVHSINAKAKLWWNPLAVQPSTHMFQEHPENLLLNKNGSPRYIQYWNAFFMCPASKEVIELSRDFVVKALKDWGFDGLKIDGNNLNAVPPCYNAEHDHAYPEESVEKLPALFKIIYETALSINPNAVIEICPCGTTQSFYIQPYMNQNVASDPSNSWQVRLKGKTLKALTRSKVVFYGDHVELSDNKSDFASTVGIGGVIGTKFIWPVGAHQNKETGDISLTPEKEKKWQKWIKIYNENMLPKGKYRGELYDMGYDRPEAHAIQKGSEMYYAFYAPEYEGILELRGLEDKTYRIIDYVNDIDLGEVNGPIGKLRAKFSEHLLIKATPIN